MIEAIQLVPAMAMDDRAWRAQAVRRLKDEQSRAQDTELLEIRLAKAPGIRLFLKDETGHPSAASSIVLPDRCS